MRRIIERVVTVVTTTTWKISWEPDLPASKMLENDVPQEIPRPIVSETEEVNLPQENAPDPL